MQEIEILVKVSTPVEEALKILQKYSFIGSKKVLDIYFYDPLRKDLQPDETAKIYRCCRLRKKDDHSFMAYKNDHYNERGEWQYSDEYETEVSDFEQALHILSKLGLAPLIEIDNIKHTFCTEYFEIVLEEVKKLGVFLEVELISAPRGYDTIEKKKAFIQEFIDGLDFEVSAEVNAGKPELMIRYLSEINELPTKRSA